jgi:hypothetical protein
MGRSRLLPYNAERNPRTGLKTGHYKPKRKAPASEISRYKSRKTQEHGQECLCHKIKN